MSSSTQSGCGKSFSNSEELSHSGMIDAARVLRQGHSPPQHVTGFFGPHGCYVSNFQKTMGCRVRRNTNPSSRHSGFNRSRRTRSRIDLPEVFVAYGDSIRVEQKKVPLEQEITHRKALKRNLCVASVQVNFSQLQD